VALLKQVKGVGTLIAYYDDVNTDYGACE
jgi:hypothetical protein